MLRSNSIFLLSCIILFLPLGSVFTKDFKALCSTCRGLVDNFDKVCLYGYIYLSIYLEENCIFKAIDLIK